MIADVLVADRRACARAIAADVRAEFERAAAGRSHFSMAVPGGSVAVHVFPAIAALDLDWACVDVFWADERAVAPADAESNYKLAASLWLEPAGVPASSVHRMPADGPDLASAAAAYETELARTLGARGRLDYLLLGAGPDGHVASLFPGHAALEESVRTVVVVEDAPKPPARRLTLTMPVLVAARRVVVAAFGDEKAEMLGEIRAHGESPLPVAQVLRRSPRPWLVADEAAGARLPAPRA